MGFFTDSNRDLKEAERRAQQESEERRRREEEDRREAEQRAEADRRAEAQRVEAQRLKARTDFLDTAGKYAENKNTAMGINDVYGLNDYYKNLLATSVAGYGENADLGSAISPDALYQQAYGDIREGTRRKALGAYNEGVGENYGTRQFGNEVDDSILDSILATGRAGADATVERARSRGILNDAGYAAATSALGTRGTAARSELEDIGQGVLGRYRGSLDTEAGNLRERAANLDLTDNFDIAGGISGLTGKSNEFRGRMEGDIRSAVGDRDFFDIGGLLGKAASEQGFNNSATPLLGAFTEGAGKKENDLNKRRLIGSTGAF